MSSLLNGFGASLSAITTTPIRIIANVEDNTMYANRLNITNLGSNTIFARINTNVAEFAASSGYALAIAPDDKLELVGDGKPPIFNIVLATNAGVTKATLNAL
jgi:hypothetical protein